MPLCYLKPRDVPSRKAATILNRLNSFDSAEQLKCTLQNHSKQSVLSIGDARRILLTKKDSGEFQDLKQIAVVPRIGAKKFDFIVRTLSN